MECAAKGSVTSRCATRPSTRLCPRCSAVAYCSVAHQISHLNYHKEECARLRQQLLHAKALNDFPFTFCERTSFMVLNESLEKCRLLMSKGLHQKGMWQCECSCSPSVPSSCDSLMPLPIITKQLKETSETEESEENEEESGKVGRSEELTGEQGDSPLG